MVEGLNGEKKFHFFRTVFFFFTIKKKCHIPKCENVDINLVDYIQWIQQKKNWRNVIIILLASYIIWISFLFGYFFCWLLLFYLFCFSLTESQSINFILYNMSSVQARPAGQSLGLRRFVDDGENFLFFLGENKFSQNLWWPFFIIKNDKDWCT